jgi:hypothetical protein
MSKHGHDPHHKARTEAERESPQGDTPTVDSDPEVLEAVRDFADEVGGLERLRDLVNYLLATRVP